jgi:hypothetical protein
MVGLLPKPEDGLTFSECCYVGGAIVRAVDFVSTQLPAVQKIMRDGFVVLWTVVLIERAIA